MKLTVNGKPFDFDGDGTIPELLEQFGADANRTAVMINGDVIPATRWSDIRITDGDQVELLVFAGGG